MILPVLHQGSLFLGSIAVGFILAFFYDILRVIRRITPHSRFFVQLEDIVYWIFVVGAMFFYILELNSGELRFFSIAGMFIGMFAYYKFVSSLFLEFSLIIYNALKKVVLLLLSIIFAPFRAVLYFLSFPASFIASKAKSAYDREKRIYRNIKIKSRHNAKKIKNNLKIIIKKT